MDLDLDTNMAPADREWADLADREWEARTGREWVALTTDRWAVAPGDRLRRREEEAAGAA